MSISVILPAAGASTRFGANKLTADLAGTPVIVHTLGAYLHRDDVEELILATRDRAALESAIARSSDADAILHHPKLRWTLGGDSRAHTVQLAAEETNADWLAIHDAARPLVTQALIDRVFRAALTHGAAAPALPVQLTIKQARGPLPAPIQRTVPRNELFAMQTPQVMRRTDLLLALSQCPLPLDQITDDVQLLELIELPVLLVEGEERNLKITTPLDLQLAELLARQ